MPLFAVLRVQVLIFTENLFFKIKLLLVQGIWFGGMASLNTSMHSMYVFMV
jgi:hypothetical protein